METPSRLALLGAEADIVTSACMLDHATEWLAAGEGGIVANHNLHSLYLYHRDREMRDFYARADIIQIDSTPVVAWGRFMGHDISRVHRSTYLDYRDDFWPRAIANGWRVYHLGGEPRHTEAARAAILARHPDADLYCRHGYFDMNGAENDAVIADIWNRQPHILLVGMGMPRQELWLHRNYERLPSLVALPVGGAFDYEAGATYTPPRWTGQVGLEWLVRWAHDPQRLFQRYFVEPWTLIPHMLRDLILKLRGGRPPERPAPARLPPQWVRPQALSSAHVVPAARPVAPEPVEVAVAHRRAGS
ncbi:MAG: WecB/TagA/CpsF family glycosyltransferase [Asticcacaulis sp.]